MNKKDEIKITNDVLKNYINFTKKQEIKIKFIYSENFCRDVLNVHAKLHRKVTLEEKKKFKNYGGLTISPNDIKESIFILINKSIIPNTVELIKILNHEITHAYDINEMLKKLKSTKYPDLLGYKYSNMFDSWTEAHAAQMCNHFYHEYIWKINIPTQKNLDDYLVNLFSNRIARMNAHESLDDAKYCIMNLLGEVISIKKLFITYTLDSSLFDENKGFKELFLFLYENDCLDLIVIKFDVMEEFFNNLLIKGELNE